METAGLNATQPLIDRRKSRTKIIKLWNWKKKGLLTLLSGAVLQGGANTETVYVAALKG